MSKINELYQQNKQSIWYDFIKKSLLTSGQLQTLLDEGLRGMTSNPSIFDNAISKTGDYDEDFSRLVGEGKTVYQIYETLALNDISHAARLMRPLYDSSSAGDGFVSLEVDPTLAFDTEKTISEAKRLFTTLAHPNVMIKVPATEEGLPAITELIASGININVTLIFSLANYHKVAEAYIKGLEILDRNGPTVKGGVTIDKIGSVASFFVSRVDTAVDILLQKMGNSQLLGKIANANAKVSYDHSLNIFSGERWEKLAARGARIQRVLWASTGTKNPDYDQLLYVNELIGPDTVNTVPPATYDRFKTDGIIKETVTVDVDEAYAQLDQLKNAGH